jgi:hypothetical protein
LIHSVHFLTANLYDSGVVAVFAVGVNL